MPEPAIVPEDVAPTMVLRDAPAISLTRVALGLTLYIDEPLVWAREGARAVLAGFLERVPAHELRTFVTSARPGFRPVTGADMAQLLRDLALPPGQAGVRHLLWVRVLDDPHAPRLCFSYREVDSTRQRRSGFVELTFPPDLDPEVLAGFVAQIGENWPHMAGVAGYTVSWNPRATASAMAAALPFCRRFLGLDLQDADSMAWHVARGLPGTGWLTLIGRGHAAALELDLDALAGRAWTNPITVTPLRHGVLVRAGQAPTLGDLNRLVFPSAYAEVGRALAPHLVKDPPRFVGESWGEEKDLTARWMRRLIDPEGWR